MADEVRKPTLDLLEGRTLTAERLADFFQRLTGRKATPEGIELYRKTLAEAQANASPSPGSASSTAQQRRRPHE